MSGANPSTARAAVMAECQRAILDAIRDRGVGDADDIQRVVTIPADIHPSIVGRAISALAHDGLIVPVDFVTTKRPAGHSHLMRSWRLADPAIGCES